MLFCYVIDEQDDYVYMKVDYHLYYKLMDLIKQETSQQGQKISPDFLRRITPFFMNQFLLWSKDQKDQNIKMVCAALEKIKSQKSSKQQKFEKGDLKYIFSEKQQKNRSYQFIKVAWKQFLQSDDILKSIQNNKKMKEESKIHYIAAIDLLLSELEKPVPYSNLLSKYKYTDNLEKKIKFNPQSNQDEIQEYQENTTCDYP